nr:MAG TPA: hypothetical protein [Bacteriophage sp.]
MDTIIAVCLIYNKTTFITNNSNSYSFTIICCVSTTYSCKFTVTITNIYTISNLSISHSH